MRPCKTRFWGRMKEVIHMDGSPHQVAFGFGLGSLIGTLPIPFIDFFIGIFLVLIFPRLHKLSLFAGIALWNPLTKIPIYTLSYGVGDWLYRNSTFLIQDLASEGSGYEFTSKFIIGNLIVATLITVVSYLLVFLVMVSIEAVKKRRARKLAREERKREENLKKDD